MGRALRLQALNDLHWELWPRPDLGTLECAGWNLPPPGSRPGATTDPVAQHNFSLSEPFAMAQHGRYPRPACPMADPHSPAQANDAAAGHGPLDLIHRAAIQTARDLLAAEKQVESLRHELAAAEHHARSLRQQLEMTVHRIDKASPTA
ncbi:hypothetical protein [Vulcanococcus limneticus]|nr:hypothetical protein [Vulcanococcus limneticus]